MCGRYSASFTPEELQRRFDLPDFAELRLPPRLPRYNVAPTDLMPVVVEDAEGRSLAVFKWGFQPYWMKPGGAPAPTNARRETVATSGLFRRALGERRCIVPATGVLLRGRDGLTGALRLTLPACGAASCWASPGFPRPQAATYRARTSSSRPSGTRSPRGSSKLRGIGWR